MGITLKPNLVYKCFSIRKLKDRRRWLEGGVWMGSQSKFLICNLAYIPNQTRHASFLVRSRPHSYRQAISPQNRARHTWKHSRRWHTMQAKPLARLWQPKMNYKQLKPYSHILSNTWCAWPINQQESIARRKKTRLLNPVAQEQDRSEHLQEFTLKRKVDRDFYYLTSISSNI
jgi:hypothetical protein